MIFFLFFLAGVFVLILLSQKSLVYLRFFQLKKKIKKNPLIGIKGENGSYYYKEKGYTVSYRISESPPDIKKVEWLTLKHRLPFFERKILNIKRSLNKFFIYQRWVALFRPAAAVVLIVASVIFYLGIKENSLKRIERFRWVVSKITGINPESIQYAGGGWFQVSGQRRPLDKKVEPVTISFSPLSWFFFRYD